MSDVLRGCRVLVVEDESLVAMLLETILDDMGCTTVGPVSSVEEGLAAVRDEEVLDAALLDVNVAGHQVFPVAQALAERGIPFVFSTGYGLCGLPEAWCGRPTIQKPFTEAMVGDALLAAIRAVRA